MLTTSLGHMTVIWFSPSITSYQFTRRHLSGLLSWLFIKLLGFAAFRTEMRAEHRTGRAPSMTGRTSFVDCINVFTRCSICLELMFSYVSSTSDRVHAFPFSPQWPLHPPHPWLRRHHPRYPTQLLIILEDPWDPTLPQPDFPGEESGRDPHPT